MPCWWPRTYAEQPPLNDRLPLEAVVHQERYSDYSEEDIDMFYEEKESLDSSKQFVDENGLETLAQVFTKVRYKKEDNVTFSNKLLEVLKKQGFLHQ
jgi:hypothetical protein